MGVKFLYSLVLCITTLCVVSGWASSVEEAEPSESSSYEETASKNASPRQDDGTQKATQDHSRGLLKRFIVPTSADIGRELLGGGNPYYTRKPQQQQRQHQQQQQQRQIQQHPHEGRTAGDPFGFGPSSSGTYNEQSESYQQAGGGTGGSISFDSTGFTDFVPSPGPFRSPPSPSAPSPFSTGSGGSSSSPFDTTGFGRDTPPSSGYTSGVGNSGYSSSSGNSGYSSGSGNPSYSSGSGSPGYSSGSGHSSFSSGSGNSGYSSGGGGGGGGGYDYTPAQQPIIHKSIYVHVAPPDDEPPRKQRVIVPNVPPKKNYQIVFIKAPTPPAPTAPIIPPPPQHLDKTLIYVLHPKPEEAPPIHIPAPPVTQPLKPEVYFIKYKTRDHGTSDGGGDLGHGGGGGGYLPEPGSDFGENPGYHRRYGRDGSEILPPRLSSTSSSAAPYTDSPEQETAGPAEQEPQATDDESDVSEAEGRSGFSSEYYNNEDASVESSNLSETRVPSSMATKGKNGH
ncbi:dermokine-like [Adelges cooleyi]|uniref:dermokine-like n=1 Tax=Adelges cooleyi TaxID=133065 RepID=UPI00217F76C3|nr:dermokine-like [Adelges cooleyi]